MLALDLFRHAAADAGWIIMSSYNSRSDTLAELNELALDAMLRSAQERLSIDRSRFYLAGFSGTGRAALRFAVSLRGHIAGVIAAGGALGFDLGGPETIFAGDSTFGYFGAAGTRDFNYEEVLEMGDRFGTLNVPFRVAVFEGPHQWPPPELCRQAIEWLELRAMRGGRRVTDSTWMRDRLKSDLARAVELERRGQGDEALRLYEAVIRDYPRSPETSTAAKRALVLRDSPAVQRHRAQARRLAQEDRRQAEDLQQTLKWARSLPDPPTAGDLERKLKIPKLKETAQNGDSLQAASAKRLLARTFVWLAFYEPRTYLANQSPGRAIVMLEAATRIGSLEGESCAFLRAALHLVPEGQNRLKGQCT